MNEYERAYESDTTHEKLIIRGRDSNLVKLKQKVLLPGCNYFFNLTVKLANNWS